ncbi:MAG: phage tail protein [Clostridiaceae bacterium]|nr:phage tail protein [Clostridiaceae bacterium]
MTDLKSGTLQDILPVNLVTPETKALSYAFANAQKKMLEFAKAIHIYAELSKVPERVLDLMALELGTQYYEQSFPRDMKEKLILQTMVWYMHAGTPSVLDEFLGTVLDGGYIEEWYDYGGSPYFFRAYALTGDQEFSPGYASDVKHQIEAYKNVRSWLEVLMFITRGEFYTPVQWRGMVTFRNHFSAYSGTELKLNGKWILNGRKKLSRFESDTNQYPVHLSFAMQAEMRVQDKAARVLLKSRMNVAGSQAVALDMKAVAEMKAVWKLENCFTGAGAAENADAKASRIDLQCVSCAQPDLSGKLGIHIEALRQREAGCGMVLKADAVAAPDAGDARITIVNNLDQKWKLNGTRKLNGGLYIG